MPAADRNPFDAVQRIVDEELARIEQAGGPGPAPQRPVAPAELARAVKNRVALFCRTVRFEIEVPGQHYSGLSNDALLEILANQGRDFLDNTSVPAKQILAKRMQESFTGFPREPTLRELRDEYAKQLRLLICNERFAGGGDQKLSPLTPEYAAWKRKKVGSRPVGVLRGRLLAAVRRNMVVRYL